MTTRPITLTYDQQQAAHFKSQRDELADELDNIRSVLLHGADENLWPPGMTLAEAIAKLKDAAAQPNNNLTTS